MTMSMEDPASLPERTVVSFACTGRAVGKMRNELDVTMLAPPSDEHWEMATDEGPFHGGDGTAPPPLAMFVGSLTGCLMTQIRAFARRMGVTLTGLEVHTTVEWDWAKAGRVYETAPKSFSISVDIDSDDPLEKQEALVRAAKKGCFLEQTLGQANRITHRIRQGEDWVAVE